MIKLYVVVGSKTGKHSNGEYYYDPEVVRVTTSNKWKKVYETKELADAACLLAANDLEYADAQVVSLEFEPIKEEVAGD